MRRITFQLYDHDTGEWPDKIISLPTYWPEVTLSHLIAIHDAGPEIDFCQMLSILTGEDIKLFRALSEIDIMQMQAALSWLKIDNLLADPDLPKESFIFKGETYFVIMDLGRDSWGALEDAKAILKQESENPLVKLPDLLGIYCRPKVKGPSKSLLDFGKKNFTIEPYDSDRAAERAKLFLGLDVKTAWSIGAFFLSVFLNSTINTVTSTKGLDIQKLRFPPVSKN